MSSNYRDLMSPGAASDVSLETLLPRRRIVAVIGIDEYRGLPKLRCAVNDALGVQALLVRHFGFEAPVAPLTNQAATKQAIEALVEDVLPKLLTSDDALILFFAGHGTTRLARVGAVTVETGYIAPVEARGPEVFSDLIDMRELLRKIALIPARHILVVLDACHSGMALGTAVSQVRSMQSFLHALAANVSRRVITSARRAETALDSGPVPGHSLFTGTLIQALTSGQADTDGNGIITFSELALCLQQRVGQVSGSRQTPDYGAFHMDDRGELILAMRHGGEPGQPVIWGAAPQGRPQAARSPRRRWGIAAAVAIACGIVGLGIALGANLLFGGGTPKSSARAAASSTPPPAPCPDGMQLIPGGNFKRGSDSPKNNSDERPMRSMQVASFCLDTTEVTVAAYEACVQRSQCRAATTSITSVAPPQYWKHYCNVDKPDRKNHPINCVDWYQADTYCRVQGKRLPEETEWEYAAKGGDEDRIYPWGNEEPDARRLNACGSECKDLHNTLDPKKITSTMYPDDDSWAGTSPVGAFSRDKSRWGVQDMGGNVHEWTSNGYCPSYLNTNCTMDNTLRGGGWTSVVPYSARTTMRHHGRPNDVAAKWGFRCARDAS